MLKKPVLLLLLTALFFSCVNHERNSGIQDIVNQWIDIDRLLTGAQDSNEAASLLEACDFFYLSVIKFQESDLHRIYRAISFLPQTERSFNIYPLRDIQEVGIVSDLALVFRDSIVSKDMEKAKTASVEITSVLIRLLMIDGEAQRFISSSYFLLLIAFIFFIVIIAFLIRFLHQSLTRSLNRETEATIFSHTYMLAQDEERARISRELHDTIIQDIRCLLLETEKIGSACEKNEDDKQDFAGQLRTKTVPMMIGLIQKTREICNNLIPPDFRFNELPDAIKQLCLNISEKTGIDCRAEIDGNIKLEFLSLEKRLQVFRIVQEALSNIEKHAKAKEAIVTMRQDSGIVYIGIGDDGKGFKSPLDDSGQIVTRITKSHIGIISMKERAAILGGRLKILSAPAGEGSLVCLEIPAVN